jgi:hypothetical protein
MFGEMPLDNRSVVQSAAVAAITGFFGCLTRDPVETT